MRHRRYRSHSNRRIGRRKEFVDRPPSKRSSDSYCHRTFRSEEKYSRSPPSKRTPSTLHLSYSSLISKKGKTLPQQHARNACQKRSSQNSFSRLPSEQGKPAVKKCVAPIRESLNVNTSVFFPLKHGDVTSTVDDFNVHSMQGHGLKNFKSSDHKGLKPLANNLLSFGLKLLANSGNSTNESVQAAFTQVHRRDKCQYSENQSEKELFDCEAKKNTLEKTLFEPNTKSEELLQIPTVNHHQSKYRCKDVKKKLQLSNTSIMPVKEKSFSNSCSNSSGLSQNFSIHLHNDKLATTHNPVEGYHEGLSSNSEPLCSNAFVNQSLGKPAAMGGVNYELTSLLTVQSKQEEFPVSYSWVGEYLDDNDDVVSQDSAPAFISPFELDGNPLCSSREENSFFHTAISKHKNMSLNSQKSDMVKPTIKFSIKKQKSSNETKFLIPQGSTSIQQQQTVEESRKGTSSNASQQKIAHNSDDPTSICEPTSAMYTSTIKDFDEDYFAIDNSMRNDSFRKPHFNQFISNIFSGHKFDKNENKPTVPGTQNYRCHMNIGKDRKGTKHRIEDEQAAVVNEDVYGVEVLQKGNATSENKASRNKYSFVCPLESRFQSTICSGDDTQHVSTENYDCSQTMLFSQTSSCNEFVGKCNAKEENKKNISLCNKTLTSFDKSLDTSYQLPRKRFESLSEQDMDVVISDDNMHGTPFCSSTSTSRVVQTKKPKSIVDFQSKWKALTNTSVKVLKSDPEYPQQNASELASEINVLSTAIRDYQGNEGSKDKRISIICSPLERNSFCAVDKREVHYSSQDASSSSLNK